MKTYKHLYQELCTKENIALAYHKAQKGKSLKPDVIQFNLNLEASHANIHALHREIAALIESLYPGQISLLQIDRLRKGVDC